MHEIASILAGLPAEEIEAFLDQILTDTEKQMIKRRWELVRLLHAGVPQRDIAARLSMSLCNVTRGSRELKRPESVFMRILGRKEKDAADETMASGAGT